MIKEALRIHPGVVFPLERYVPPEGATICDYYLPAGTNISVNPAVVHMDRGVYGDNADEFVPERWIDASPEQLKQMDRSFIAVGLRVAATYDHPLTKLVWIWSSDLHWEEHLDVGDGQIHTPDIQIL